ncbi:hypothetical protein IAQ61_005691 [Plenodomus lingam]|uniref:uncharacterized protein n=1 Tax=Leptosphaeria maculans TaxID=5022 RepID=UPI003329FC8A|nr:hypothetical protein IAQ61_005691 [Plenodomus lingam]
MYRQSIARVSSDDYQSDMSVDRIASDKTGATSVERLHGSPSDLAKEWIVSPNFICRLPHRSAPQATWSLGRSTLDVFPVHCLLYAEYSMDIYPQAHGFRLDSLDQIVRMYSADGSAEDTAMF